MLLTTNCKVHTVTPVVLIALTLLVAACAPVTKPTHITAPTSPPSAAVKPTAAPTATPAPTTTPTSQPTPRPVEGYWIQNTTGEGLCSDSPRFVGFDDHYNRPCVGDSDATICYFDHFGLDRWTRDLPSPTFGFPSWISVDIPGIGRVTGGAAFSPYAPANPHVPSYPGVYGMPSFVGSGEQCVLDAEGEWRCFTVSDGLPFDDVRDYGIVQESNVEWFTSADSVASRGPQPRDLSYSIPELVEERLLRPRITRNLPSTGTSAELSRSPQDDCSIDSKSVW